MISIINHNSNSTKIKGWSVLFWLAVWEIASRLLGQSLLLASPLTVIKRLAVLAVTTPFWQSILFSLLRIIGGFLCGVLFGTLLAIFAVNHTKFEELIAPLILLIKTIPVASFIILVLIFISSKNLSVMISFLMVLPIVYTNVRNGILETDRNLLEMANVFSLSRFKKFRYIYVPQVFPYFQSACSVCLGLAFKSGIAAEVIGIPTGSIGEHLYNAKIYLNTPDLFAWTLVIVLLSLTLEKLLLALLHVCMTYIERG